MLSIAPLQVYERSMQVMRARMGADPTTAHPGVQPGMLPVEDDLPDIDIGMDGLTELDPPQQRPARGLTALPAAPGLRASRHQQQGMWASSSMPWQPVVQQQQQQLGRGSALAPTIVPSTQAGASMQLRPGLHTRGLTPARGQGLQQAALATSLHQAPQLPGHHGLGLPPSTLPDSWMHGSGQFAGGTQQQQQLGRPGVDEFGISLAHSSLSDEESDRDATLSAQLSPLGFGRPQAPPVRVRVQW